MAVPTLITDLSTTAASNSPAGSDSPVDTDNFIRALSAFIAQNYANKATIAAPTFTGTVTIPTLAVSGNSTLGDAVTDTVTVGGVVVKGSAGNWAIPAPSSGDALTITAVGANDGVYISSAASNNASIALAAVSYAREWRMQALNADGAWNLRDETRGANTISVSITGKLTVPAASSGYALNIPTGTPASAGAAGVAGDVAWDADYIYICTATNTWKRVAITTW